MVLLESINIPLGKPAADFSLKGVDEKFYSLESFVDAKVLVIVFMCNHCPYVRAIWDRLVNLQAEFEKSGVKFVGINPNINPNYEEDSFENMKKYHVDYKMNFPYLLDEKQLVAMEYKAQCTPDIFVFDEQRFLAYHGRPDDDLKNALLKLLQGLKPDELQYPSIGCSIKWVD